MRIASKAFFWVGALSALCASGSANAASGDDRFKHCLTLPVQGAHVVNDHSMALVDKNGRVALVDLSSSCLQGRARQIALVLARDSSVVCSRTDIDTVLNAQQTHGGMSSDGTMPTYSDMSGQCVAQGFMIIGHLDKDGFIVKENGKRLDGTEINSAP